MSTNVHLRGLDDRLFSTLKQTASVQKISMNRLVLNLLHLSLGFPQEHKSHVYHDLDKLAGTWSNKETKEFLHNLSDFEQIDQDIWK